MNLRKRNPLIEFIQQHPQLTLSAGYLLLICMGILYDYHLSNYIGVNILEFSSLSDLVMTPIRNQRIVHIWLFFMGFLFLLVVLNKWMESKEKLYKWLHFGIDVKKKSWYPYYFWGGILCAFFLYSYNAAALAAKSSFKNAQKGKTEAFHVYSGRSNEHKSTGFLISKTDAAYFLYDTSTKSTIILNDNLVHRLEPISENEYPNVADTNIRQIMATQESAWNQGDIESFMEGYWRSDSLCFIGSKGLTYGWQQTLENYEKGYPDPASMGTLKFTLKKVEQTSSTTAFVIGAWHLARPEKGDVGGHFTLFWKKIKEEWLIVADHSS